MSGRCVIECSASTSMGCSTLGHQTKYLKHHISSRDCGGSASVEWRRHFDQIAPYNVQPTHAAKNDLGITHCQSPRFRSANPRREYRIKSIDVECDVCPATADTPA